MSTAVRDNKTEINDIFAGLHDTISGTGHFFKQNKDRLDRIAENAERITVDTNELIQATRSQYVDSPKINRIIDNIDRTSTAISRDADPLLHDAREAMANVNRVTSAVGSPTEQAKLKQTLTDVAEIARRGKAAAADAQAIVAHVKKGDGSVGALVMDEQVYDDLQEMVRDLKHNPWKFFWKE